MKEEILEEITDFCKECTSKDQCPEGECILFRIEKIITRKKKVDVSKGNK